MNCIVTHNGTHHADEALAVYLLKQLPKFADYKVIRTRDPEIIKQGSIVVDVGAVYEAPTRLDHHQREFDTKWPGCTITKLSSAGLVWLHYGKQIMSQKLKSNDDAKVALVWQALYDRFILAFDAIDNGVTAGEDLLYTDRTGISSRVARLNPRWNQTASEEEAMQRFMKAVTLTGEEFEAAFDDYVLGMLPARKIVEDAVHSRMSVDPTGQIIKLSQFAPWSEHLFDLEKTLGCEGNILYVIFPDTSGMWRVQAVPTKPGSFETRKALPEPWRGLRDAVLEAVCGISGATFVHAGGFIAGSKTEGGAVEMARKALKM
jgi:uncharacterized UPF0160 family protein